MRHLQNEMSHKFDLVVDWILTFYAESLEQLEGVLRSPTGSQQLSCIVEQDKSKHMLYDN